MKLQFSRWGWAALSSRLRGMFNLNDSRWGRGDEKPNDDGKPDTPPQYVLSFDLYENGIARALRLDYGDFVLGGDMTELAYMGDGACRK